MAKKHQLDPAPEMLCWHTAGSVREFLGEDACALLKGSTRKWSPEVWANILQAGAVGLSWETAVSAHGVSTTSTREWRGICPALTDSWEAAVSDGKLRLVARLQSFAQCDPDQLRWLGERLVPELSPPERRKTITVIAKPVKVELVDKGVDPDSVGLPEGLSEEITDE